MSAQRLGGVGGASRPVVAWAAESGLACSTIRSRLDRLGWPAERAVREPALFRFPKLELHKPSRQGFCRWTRAGGGYEYRYLGPWGAAATERAYARFVAAWPRAIRGGGDGPSRRYRGGVPAGVVRLTLRHLHGTPSRQRCLSAVVEFIRATGCPPGVACGMTLSGVSGAGGYAEAVAGAGGALGVAVADATRRAGEGEADPALFRWCPGRRDKRQGWRAVSPRVLRMAIASACRRAGVWVWAPRALIDPDKLAHRSDV